MRPVTVTTPGGTAVSTPVPLDINQGDFAVGFGCVVSGTVNYTVQHTFHDPWAADFASAVWFDHPTVAGETTNQDGNYAYGVRAIRINQASGAGTVSMTVIQTGASSS